MKLTVLSENVAGQRFLAEHGLSYLIDCAGERILFDTGHSDIFLKNAEILKINIHEEVNTIILSHGHWDHGDGLNYLNNKTLISHPAAFIKRFHKNEKTNLGLSLGRDELELRFRLITSSESYFINQNIIFLGEIPRKNDFEAKTTAFEDLNGNEDFVPDDSALAIIEHDGLIIVTGCSHAGICNIIEYAKAVSGLNRIKSVIGGFHLKHNNTQTQKTIQYFKDNDVGSVYPSHCTELPAMYAFYKSFRNQQVKTGMTLTFK